MAKPTDSDLEPRVEQLELTVAALVEQVGMLEERVITLEESVELPIDPPIDPPIEPTTGLLVLELNLPGGTLSFDEADATDIGDYVGEFVHQRCLALRQGPWTVFFRPDADGRRDEIVVEYGAYDFSVSPAQPIGTPAHILEPFTATIKRGDATLATVTVPKQYWLTRWRWQSAPRPIVRGHDDLVAMKAILPLDDGALWNNPADFSLPAAVWSGPMGAAGLRTYMPNTGDRPEIGPITDLQGSYLMRDNPEARDGMLAQAEAVGSFPFWLRTADGNLLDVYACPYQGLRTTANAAKYPKLYPAYPADDPNFIQLDRAHFPAVAYVPWLLTDDPYFLEGAQMSAIHAAVEANYHQINQELPGLANPSQKRAWGWGCRDILRMAVMAPENPPAWLQSQDYFWKMANDNLTFVQRSMASTSVTCSVFHMLIVAPAPISITCWEEGYGLVGFGWAKWSRALPEWDEAVDWLAETLIRLSDEVALGGWDRRWPALYRFAIDSAQTWGEFWTNYKASLATPLNIGPEDKIYQNRIDNPANVNTSPHYQEVMVGALQALANGGVPEAAEHVDWMRARMPPVTATYDDWPSSFRYAYSPA